jgi:m7GpppX diphosphatase
VRLQFSGATPSQYARIVVDVIDPCTDKHIQKYSTQKAFMIVETPELYVNVTLPFIQAIPASALQWVYNILDHAAEPERKVYEDLDPDTGFVMQTDLKWEQSRLDQLHCLAIVKRRDLRSIRDLRPSHGPLLRNIIESGCRAINEKFGVDKSQLRIFLHYIPSYWHLHVHFVHVAQEPSHAMMIGRAHEVWGVLTNLSLHPNYYAQATLTCVLGECDALYAKLKA